MSFQVQYFYQFRDLNDQLYRVEILKNSEATITPEEIEGSTKPFSVEYPSVDKFEPIHGSGCELNVISSTNMKFLSLYTADMMEYQIHFYKVIDGIDYLIWAGYKDSELYREDFSQVSDYPVQFTGNDGFNLLERLNFVDESGANYSGIKSQWDILKIIFTRLNLPIQKLYVCISTVLDDSPAGVTETIFHKQYAISENFYDEDGKPSTLRDVLESFLKPLGAFIIQDGGNYFICDINSLAKNIDLTFKVYSLSDFSYIHDEMVNTSIGDLSDIGFASDKQNFEFIPGFNRQVVSWSPYRNNNIIEFKAEDDFKELGSTNTFGSGNYRWNEKSYNKSDSWTKYNFAEFCDCVGIGVENLDQKDSYLKVVKGFFSDNVLENQYSLENLSFIYKKQLPEIIPAGYSLKVNLKVYPVTKADLGNSQENSQTEILSLWLCCQLKIGDKKWIGKWIDASYTSSDPFKMNTLFNFSNPFTYDGDHGWKNGPSIADSWTEAKEHIYYYDGQIKTKDILIPLSGINGGQLSFMIYHYQISSSYNGDCDISKISAVRVKDLSITLVDENGNELENSDVEYEGSLDPLYKNEASKIELIQGTNEKEIPTAFGSILYKDGTQFKFCKNWTRESKTDIIERLLIRSVQSNSKEASTKLTADLNYFFTSFGILTYNNYLPGKALAISAITHNYEDAESGVELIEIRPDSLEIETI